jgi:hypothetical protein
MYGNFNFPQLPYSKYEAGVDLGNALVLATGGNVVYLRSTGPADYDPPALTGRIVTTLSQALSQCRANKADTILVLPGHTESVTATAGTLSGLTAGTRIVGVGRGSNMPTFTWTATGSNWAVNVANVFISGLRLDMAGINAVVAGITITGADCCVSDCDIQVNTGTIAGAVDPILISGTAAHRAQVIGNRFRGLHATGGTRAVHVFGAVDGVEIKGNTIMAAFANTTVTGPIHVNAAATNVNIGDNVIYNSNAASTRCIQFGTQAATGIAYRNAMYITGSTTASYGGIGFGGSQPLIGCIENYCVDEKQASGILSPLAGT